MMALVLDYWMQYTAVVSACIFFFCLSWVRPRFGAPAAALLCCCAFSAIWAWVYVPNRYVFVDPYNQMAIRYFAADSMAKIMLIVVPMMAYSDVRDDMRIMGERLCAIFVCASSAFTLYEARRGCGSLNCGGLIGNPSISMGLLACMLPVAIHSWKSQWPILALSSTAILLSKSSVAAGLLAVYLAASLIPWGKKIAWKPIGVSLAAFIVVMITARLALGAELFNDSDRFKLWRFMMGAWASDARNLLFGTGLGTFHVLTLHLDHAPGHTPIGGGSGAGVYWWNTMHQDFFQQIFETGIIGGLLMCAAYCSALLKVLRERDWSIALSVVLFGLYMCLDPALHNPLPILFGAWLFAYALRKPTKEYVYESPD